MQVPTKRYVLDGAEIVPSERRLVIDGHVASIGARAFDVLIALIQHRDRLVSKNELLEVAWPGRVVGENNLAVQVGTLRKVLGSNAISTVPGRGYRFTAPVVASGIGPAPGAVSTIAGEPTAPLRTIAADPLVGRDKDIALLREKVRASRLVTIVGSAGMGKSRLAKQFLEDCGDLHEHGVAWVDLASVPDGSTMVATIAQSLGVDMGGGNPLRGLSKILSQLDIVVVLDGAEHLANDTADLVEVLLADATRLRIVVTSQVALRVTGERVLRLEPLSLPPEGPIKASEALRYPAVTLFLRRARAVEYRFELSGRNAEVVCSICRRLDGIPMAIELAAARIPLLGVSGLAAALDQRLNVLKSSRRNIAVRQRSLRSALEWSHHLLGADQQRVLRRLGIFARSFSLELALATVPDPDEDRWDVLDALGALVDFSLIETGPEDPPRYRLFESTRVFALERLEAGGDMDTLRARHARSVCKHFTDTFASGISGAVTIDAARTALEPDAANGRTAMRWALAHDAPTALALAPALDFVLRGPDFEGMRDMWTATAALWTNAQPESLRASYAVGCVTFWANNRDMAMATRWARAALEMCEPLKDRAGMYIAHAALLVAAARRGESCGVEFAALERLDSQDLFPRIRLRGLEARNAAACSLGRTEEARLACLEALELAKRAGDRQVELSSMINLADVENLAGRPDEAVAHGLEIIERTAGTRHVEQHACALLNLCGAALAKGDTVQARLAVEDGWPFAAAFGLLPFWSDYLALLAAMEGRASDAARLLGYGDARYRAYATARVANELRAAARAEVLACQSLSAAEFAQLRIAGSTLCEEEIPALCQHLA